MHLAMDITQSTWLWTLAIVAGHGHWSGHLLRYLALDIAKVPGLDIGQKLPGHGH